MGFGVLSGSCAWGRISWGRISLQDRGTGEGTDLMQDAGHKYWGTGTMKGVKARG